MTRLIEVARDYQATGGYNAFLDALVSAFGSSGLLASADAIVILADDRAQLLAALEAAEKERDALLAEREEARRTAARIADAQPPPEAIVIASAAAERAYDAALATFRAEQPTSGDEDD